MWEVNNNFFFCNKPDMNPPFPKKWGTKDSRVPWWSQNGSTSNGENEGKDKILSSISYLFQMVNQTSRLFLNNTENHQHNQLKYTYFMKHLVE